MAAEHEPCSNDIGCLALRQDRAQRALQVSVISGFVGDCRAVQESCLGLCNVCRDGVPVGCIRFGINVPLTTLSMVLPNASSTADHGPVTRVLQPRRVLGIIWGVSEEDDTPDGEDVSGHEGEKSVDQKSTEDVAGRASQARLERVGLANVKWPDGVISLRLTKFDRTLEGITWPKGLQRLWFYDPTDALNDICSLFKQPLQGVKFPSGLREIFLGTGFNSPIEDVIWPDGLERLSLPGFNHAIDGVRWPPRLTSLEFLPPSQLVLRQTNHVGAEGINAGFFITAGFDRPIATLPASLETLWLSDAFAQESLANIVWPSGLTTLGLGRSFGHYLLGRISWPSSVRHVYVLQNVVEANAPPAACVVHVYPDPDSDSQSLDADHYDLAYELDDYDIQGHLHVPDYDIDDDAYHYDLEGPAM